MVMVENKDAAERNDQVPTAAPGQTEACAETWAETPGALLRCAREEAGLGRHHVAERLNLLNAQVIAIEEDRYDRLPGDTFTIGYLRNYARATGIDPDRVLQAFFAMRPQCRPMRVRVDGVVKNGPSRPLTLNNAHPRRHYWGLAAAGLVLAVLWGWQQVQAPVEVLPLTADLNGVDIALPGGLDVVVSDTGGNAGLLDTVHLQEPYLAREQQSAMAMRAVATLPDMPMPDDDAVEEMPPAPAADLVDDRLNLRFSADCWVEVKDRDNRVLVAALKRADEQLTVQGRGPFKVVLGFAPGVEMAFNGQPVDIETANGDRAARLIVGNS